MNNIKKVSDAYLCSNCGACKTICPKNAIYFRYSSMGRMYAAVNEACINCGLCTKVCPSLNDVSIELQDRYVGNIEALYTGKATNEQIFNNAQSGGVCTAVLSYLFRTEKIDCAVVCVMIAGETPVVQSAIVTSADQLAKSQKSCYTPVDMLSILREVKEYKSVAFVGLPCHIQGLVLLQKTSKLYDNVKYKLGLICDRTLCTTIQDVFVNNYANRFRGKNVKIDWRRKCLTNNKFEYKTAPVVIYSEQEEVSISNGVRFYLKEPFTPPRCRVCCDKINVHADLVFGDPWRMENVDEDRGESVIIARTTIGNALIQEMKVSSDLELVLRKNNEIIRGQLINERKEQVSIWTEALAVLPNQIETYLMNSFAINDPQKVENARIMLRQFVENESKEKTEVVKLIINDVKTFERKIKSPFRRMAHRILKELRNLLKK